MDVNQVKILKVKCLSHAKELIRGSKLLLENNLPSIAYHLAVLALEEVGKSAMILMSHVTSDKDKGIRLLKKSEEGHEKKIFYALWLPSLGKEKCTASQVQSYIKLSSDIHFLRLKGLYVDPDNVEEDPGLVIPPEQANRMISLAESRINMEECYEIKDPEEKIKTDFVWFEQAVQDIEKKKLILGQKSLDKLNQLEGSVVEWISWMKEQFDQAERESLDLTKQELSRKEPQEAEKIKPKWRIKVRLFTLSHSIRQSILDQFNKKIPKFKFMAGKRGRVSELIIENTLPLGVPVQALWYAAWGDTRKFVISLNIATQGYFWWYHPKDISKFYENITDLENNAEIRVERQPVLRLDWGNKVLSEQNFINAVLCYRFLPNDNVDFLTAYCAGISLFGKNDIHTPFEKEIFLQFYHALIYAMRFYQELKENEDVAEAVVQRIKEIGGPDFVDTARECVKMANNLLAAKEEKITLTECGVMKILCDFYILKKMIKMANEDVQEIDNSANKVQI